MIAKAVIQLLLAHAELISIVGKRIRPNVIKTTETFPAMYVSSYRMEKLDCDDSSGIYSGVIEIGIFSDKYDQCSQIMSLVRNVLDEYSGLVDNVGITIHRGEEAPDDFDEAVTYHIKVIEYQAYAQIKN